jgi:TrpR family trp operon transcriptional repressor
VSKSKECLQEFAKLCRETQSETQLLELFDLFFTPDEIDNLKLRYSIVQALLQQTKPQRQIAKELNVSIAKITRGSNELKRLNQAFLQYLKEKMCD